MKFVRSLGMLVLLACVSITLGCNGGEQAGTAAPAGGDAAGSVTGGGAPAADATAAEAPAAETPAAPAEEAPKEEAPKEEAAEGSSQGSCRRRSS